MGLRAKIQEDIADFKAGFSDGYENTDYQPQSPIADWSGMIAVGAFRVALMGFLAALPGVPFLPWGRPGVLAATLVIALLSSVNLHDRPPRLQIVRAVPVIVTAAIILRLGPPTTSMLLVGALISTLSSLAKNYPMMYGIFFGMVVGVLAVKIADANVFNAQQLLLSGREFTPDRGAAEGLRLAGFLFLTGLLNFTALEAQQLRTKAKEAEAAREAAVVDERARIARELHDVVSHHVTAMTLQAEAAAITGDKQALASVASAGRDALTELRRMLGVLRRPENESTDAMEPQPVLDQLDALAARANSGPRVHIERVGNVRPLSAGLELGAFRLVQEALTNTAKHSDATEVEVVLTYGDSSLTVDVIDNGRPLAAARVSSGGLGLVGMQERIALLDGEFWTGRRSDAQGYRVHATLPIDA